VAIHFYLLLLNQKLSMYIRSNGDGVVLSNTREARAQGKEGIPQNKAICSLKNISAGEVNLRIRCFVYLSLKLVQMLH